MSLQRRLLLYLLLGAPLVWAIGFAFSVDRARHEVNELFDTELIRLTGQVQAALIGTVAPGQVPAPAPASGEADLQDLAVAVWDTRGKLLLVDREGQRLPHRPDASGFTELTIAGEAWRAFYLQSPNGELLVAAAQREPERDELVWGLVGSQMLPWLAVLPLLLLAMAWAVRQALAPMRTLTAELRERDADNLQPLAATTAPAELRPLLSATNDLFARIEAARAREKRFTADAAHELRTPLAALRAQWDVLRRSPPGAGRERAESQLAAGLDRVDRLVAQMLALARVESIEQLRDTRPIVWPRVVEQAISDVLPLAEQRGIELGCDWPPGGEAPLPLRGDPGLVAVLLRNLLDNAVRYAPADSAVTLRFGARGFTVENDGEPLPAETLARLGERFHRHADAGDAGSGLGVSIVQRIAALHGLAIGYRSRPSGRGVVAAVSLR